MLISFAVTAKLICVIVFAYADCWFSHEAAQYTVNPVIFRENLIFANIREFDASRIQGSRLLIISIGHKDCKSTCSRIQNLANNSEIENLRNKSHTKISGFTVYQIKLSSLPHQTKHIMRKSIFLGFRTGLTQAIPEISDDVAHI